MEEVDKLKIIKMMAIECIAVEDKASAARFQHRYDENKLREEIKSLNVELARSHHQFKEYKDAVLPNQLKLEKRIMDLEKEIKEPK